MLLQPFFMSVTVNAHLGALDSNSIILGKASEAEHTWMLMGIMLNKKHHEVYAYFSSASQALINRFTEPGVENHVTHLVVLN